MKRLGMDLGVLDGAPPPTLQNDTPACPGAALRVNREALAELRRGGEYFVPGNDSVPHDALGTVRVSCRASVATLPKTASGAVQSYGLCHSCSGLEVTNREWLRARAGTR